LFGCCWYEVIDRQKGVAYKQLSVEQLQEAIFVAEAIIDRPDSYIQHGAFSVTKDLSACSFPQKSRLS
jgi:hypothetical protein